MSQRDQVFVSYSHADAQFLKRLRVHFTPFERDYSIKVWSDEKIHAGQQWREEIEKALKQTAVAILLVSADFLASDFIVKQELPPLLDAAQSEGVSILCFILSHCSFTSTRLAKYQAVNDPAKPLTSLNKKAKREELWVDLVQKTTQALDKFKAQQIAAQALDRIGPSPQNSVKWNKVATLFWLGNDLMWIQDMTYRGAVPHRILQGVVNAEYYVKELGFPPQSLPLEQLALAKKTLATLFEVLPSDPETLPNFQERYREVRQNVETVKSYIDRLAREQEPTFEKKRA
jgi:hypothetical protein